MQISEKTEQGYKGGQTAILVRWSAAERTSGLEKIADQRQRTTEIR
jgi:hypothetical protein